MTKSDPRLNPWASYLGPNLGYVQEQYERFISNPDSVEPAFQTLFTTFGELPAELEEKREPAPAPIATPIATPNAKINLNSLKNVGLQRISWFGI